MPWGRCRYNKSDQAFIPTANREVHVKAVGGTPMPVKHCISRRRMPVKISRFPNLRNSIAEILFDLSVMAKVFAGREQAHHQVGGFHDISTIIQSSESNGFACY